MRPTEIISILLLVCALAGLTAISSKKFGEPDREAALASAIKAEFDGVLGDAIYSKSEDSPPPVTLCLESQATFDLDALSEHLSDTVLRPARTSSCRREIEEGDFGMFTAIYHHFGPSGEGAVHLKVAKIKCPTSSSCAIDIDRFGGGDRHFVERQGPDWKVVDRAMRWIV